MDERVERWGKLASRRIFLLLDGGVAILPIYAFGAVHKTLKVPIAYRQPYPLPADDDVLDSTRYALAPPFSRYIEFALAELTDEMAIYEPIDSWLRLNSSRSIAIPTPMETLL